MSNAAKEKSKKPPLTAERLRELLAYDPHAGTFVWREYRAKNAQPGSLAGWINTDRNGYRSVRINLCGGKYRAHRLAWLYVTGAWPDNEIDHIDGDGTNNRWGNLREATRNENQRNRRPQSNNTSGFKGVSFERGKWRAQIKFGEAGKCLGHFATPEDAYAAYCEAAEKYHGEFARVA